MMIILTDIALLWRR